MQIRKIISGPIETNCYLVWDEDSRKAMLVDAPKDCLEEVMKILEKSKLRLVLLANTHGHWDHVSDNFHVKKKTGAKIAVHTEDERLLWKPVTAIKLPFEIPASKADKYLDEGDVIKIGSLSFDVIETPGHSPGSVCLYEARNGVLFSGDTLFAGTYGRTDFPGGDHKKIIASLKKLIKLPQDTKIYPGHGPDTLLSREKWIEDMV